MSNVKQIAKEILSLQKVAELFEDQLRNYQLPISAIGINNIDSIVYVYTSKKLIKDTKEFIRTLFIKLNSPYRLEIKHLGIPKR